MTTATDSDVYYDPYDVDINADPYPTYQRLRDEAPIYHNERYDFWALSRHADVEKALVDWQHFSNCRSDILEIIQSGMELPPGVVMFEDPPMHTMHRGLMSRVFTPRRMAALEDQVRAFCVSCLDPLVGTDRFDIVAELGAVHADAGDRHAPRHPRVRPDDGPRPHRRHAAHPGRAARWRSGRTPSPTARCSPTTSTGGPSHPSDDLMTALLTAEFEDETGTTRTLTRPEVLTYTQVLAGAGNETTGRLIGWLAKVLAEHPDQRRDLVEDRSLIPKAVDETLRFEPTGPHLARYVAQDVEYYGTTVPEGSAMLLLVGSANRDERRYERRRRVRHPPHRRPAPHLRLRPALLPRRQPRPARGAGGARRAAHPLPRVGGRLRRHRAVADLHRARLGVDADRRRLTTGSVYAPPSRVASRAWVSCWNTRISTMRPSATRNSSTTSTVAERPVRLGRPGLGRHLHGGVAAGPEVGLADRALPVLGERGAHRVERTDAGGLVVPLCFGGMPADEATANFELFAAKVLPELRRHDVGGDLGITYATSSAAVA